MVTVEDPFAQPRFHRSFADGLGGLSEYVMEVVHGAHDYWIKPREEILKGVDSVDTRWSYTYHRRLVEFEIDDEVIDAASETVIVTLAAGSYAIGSPSSECATPVNST